MEEITRKEFKLLVQEGRDVFLLTGDSYSKLDVQSLSEFFRLNPDGTFIVSYSSERIWVESIIADAEVFEIKTLPPGKSDEVS